MNEGGGPGESWALQPRGIWPQTRNNYNVARRQAGGGEGGPERASREAGLPAARIYGSNGCSTQFLLRVKVKKRLSHHH